MQQLLSRRRVAFGVAFAALLTFLLLGLLSSNAELPFHVERRDLVPVPSGAEAASNDVRFPLERPEAWEKALTERTAVVVVGKDAPADSPDVMHFETLGRVNPANEAAMESTYLSAVSLFESAIGRQDPKSLEDLADLAKCSLRLAGSRAIVDLIRNHHYITLRSETDFPLILDAYVETFLTAGTIDDKPVKVLFVLPYSEHKDLRDLRDRHEELLMACSEEACARFNQMSMADRLARTAVIRDLRARAETTQPNASERSRIEYLISEAVRGLGPEVRLDEAEVLLYPRAR